MGRELISIERARELVLERVAPGPSEAVPLDGARGRFLSAPAVAAIDVPGFDNSAMDGYAVRASDTAGATTSAPKRLRLAGESRAGSPADAEVGPGEAIAISTGAMMPAGADAVIRVEDTARVESDPVVVEVRTEVEPARNVRRAGEDIRAGAEAIASGTRLGAAELGVLATIGAAEPICAARPRLSVLTTGDELVPAGEPLGPGQIHESNGIAVATLADGSGAEVVSRRVAADTRETTAAELATALDADVAVICGGVSVGEHDHVRPALESLGVEQVFWGVSLRPGKPTYFGLAPDGAPVFGLPGNPVSAMVTFVLFVRPALLRMQGADPAASRLTARLAEPYRKVEGRAEAIRVVLEPGPEGLLARPTGPQSSHILTSMLGADGLAFAPTDRVELEAGEEIGVELLS